MKRRTALKQLAGLGAIGLRFSHPLNFNDTIKTRIIPASGEELPMVGLGTWRTFDVGSSEAERAPLVNVLKTLTGQGGSVVDSSPMYGRSEGVVGDLASQLGIVSKLFMATKVWTSGKQAGIEQMETSMRRMKKSRMDLMQIHNLVDWQTHMQTLRDWREQGKIKYIGITHYMESAYDNMERIMKNYPIDFIQLNYSIISRTAEKSILPLAKDIGIAVLINRPYEGGSLFGKIKGKTLPEWVSDFDCQSWGQFFLKFILSNHAVTCVIPGTSKPHHMADNLGAGMGILPNQVMREKMAGYVENL